MDNPNVVELIDKSLLSSVPGELEPTMQNAWRVFHHLTHHLDNTAREQAWQALRDKVAPDHRDQIDYTPEHWRQILDLILGNNQESSTQN